MNVPFSQDQSDDPDQIRSAISSTHHAVEFELSASVEKLLRQLMCLSEQLHSSADSNNAPLHFGQAVSACRLSRRIRLKMGNLRKLSGTVRARVVEVFVACAKNVNPGLGFDDLKRSHVKHAKANINIRVSHIEQPQKVEEELLGLS